MFAGATRTIAAVALAGAMVAGRVRRLHFTAISDIYIDLCSPVQPLARCGRCGCTFRKEFLCKCILSLAPKTWSW